MPPALLSPRAIRLDVATACQLRCPACPTTLGIIRDDLGTGFVRLDDFRRLLEANPGVRSIELSNWGEIFLNPDLLAMMELAAERGVALSAKNGANLNTVADGVLEGLVRYRFRAITCSIDGASPETYAVYRRRGDFDTVLANIRKINGFKARYGSKYPKLTWQFVVFGHNEHEIPRARALAQELGMELRVKLSWGGTYLGEDFSPVRNREAVRKEISGGVADRTEYETRFGVRYGQRRTCAQMWTDPQINWDGRVLGCCVNHWGDYGNAFRDGLAETCGGERMSYARAMLMGEAPARADIPCTTCANYTAMQRTGRWITEREISHAGLARRVRSLLGSARRGVLARLRGPA